MNGRWKERIKSVTLALLVLLLMAQLKMTWTYGQNGQFSLGQLFSSTQNGIGQQLDCAAYPVELAVYGQNGFYAKRSGEIQTDFNSVLPVLQCAVQQAGTFREVADFEGDLDQPLVYVKYNGQIPLSVFCQWIDCREHEQDLMLGSLIAVQSEENGSRLYIRDSRDQKLYRAETDVDDPLFSQYTGQFSASGGGFAWQLQYEHLLPETLVMEGTEKLNILRADVPVFDDSDSQASLQKLLEAFSYNPYTVKSYKENGDEATVFVENRSTLTMNIDGYLVFEATGADGGLTVTDEEEVAVAEYTDYGGQMACQVLESIGGGQVYMVSIEENDQVYSVAYQQMVMGVPVDDQVHGYFAKLYFQDGKMTRGDFYLRRYEETGEVLGLMPGRQLAQMVTGVREVTIRYEDTGGERVVPRWKQSGGQEE